MINEHTKPKNAAAARILNTASELFYTQGYRATGINEIIKTSGVAKATFYTHFSAKDDLCIAYLEGMSETILNYYEIAIAEADGPIERFLAVAKSLEPWLIETNFRGCAFLNMASEIPDYDNHLRKPGVKIYSAIQNRIIILSEELINSNQIKYKKLNPEKLSKDYMLFFAGAVALSELYNNISPAKDALNNICCLIDHHLK